MKKKLQLPSWFQNRFHSWLQKKLIGHFLALGAGCLITLSQAPFNIWPLAILAPLSLWLLLRQLSAKQAFWRGWFFGLGVFASGASWVFVSIYEFSATPLVFALFLTGLFIAALSLFFALHAWLWQVFLASTQPLVSWPALWILMEALRGWLFTGFPWLLLGTAQIHTSLKGYLPVIGVFGVSGLSVLAGMLVYESVRRGSQKRILALSCLVSLFAGGNLLSNKQWTTEFGAELSLGLVQGNIAQEIKWNPNKALEIVRTYIDLSHELGAVDVLIWPETALPLEPKNAAPYLDWALEKAKPNASLITGLIETKQTPQQLKYYNGIFSHGAASSHYYKTQLVPFGEYVPFESLLRGTLDFFNLPMSSFSKGTQIPQSLAIDGGKVAPLICYEIAYPNLSAKQAKDTNWLVTISNDAWFGASIGPIQHLQLAQVRALETSRPVARVTNTGLSAVINHQGEITTQLPQFKKVSQTASLQPRQGNTPFMLTGSLPLLAWCLFLLETQRFRLRQLNKRRRRAK